MATNESEPRVVEPAVTVKTSTLGTDKRKEIASRFDAENPGYVHVWMDADTPEEDLAIGEYQKVAWAKDDGVAAALIGKPVRVRRDVLCKIKKESFNAPRREGEELSRQLVEQSMRGRDEGEDIKWQPRNLVRKPRDPRDIGKPVN